MPNLFEVQPFKFLRDAGKAEPAQAADLIQDESPKTVALILANLEIDFAARVMMEFSPDFQVDVAKEMVTTEKFSPEEVAEVEKNLYDKLLKRSETQYLVRQGGVAAIVEILNRISRNRERAIISALNAMTEEVPTEIALEIRRRLFVFDDIVLLDDNSLQKIFGEVGTKDLALAIKTIPPKVSERIFKNMSESDADKLREEIQSAGKAELIDVIKAQRKIINLIHTMAKNGEIVFSSTQGDEKSV